MYEIGRFLYEIETCHLRGASGERTPPNFWTPPSLPSKGRDRVSSGISLGEGGPLLASP